MILDDSKSNTEIKISSTLHHPTLITPLQQLDNNPFITPGGPLPKNTPSGSQVVTFSNSKLSSSKITLKSSEDMIKFSEDSINDKGKRENKIT
ncbi:hypothetical protein RCL_jg14636.t1 [Rhizophagus clarus]|uniref:Uncharacterized protein n=1 Tax=Rhizophagus clarus TaxID=94130 RepID=A0A8H3M0U1_9GLOM|nr:hypothetical protein RCL_jg14636.t1 [Rhizophagus clarus]